MTNLLVVRRSLHTARREFLQDAAAQAISCRSGRADLTVRENHVLFKINSACSRVWVEADRHVGMLGGRCRFATWYGPTTHIPDEANLLGPGPVSAEFCCN